MFKDTLFVNGTGVACSVEDLNTRASIIVERSKAYISGKKILDIGCHDGRFIFACLKHGAKHVTGIELREENFKVAERVLPKYFKHTRYKLKNRNIFDYLERVRPGQFDTILCAGFLYHTSRQLEFLEHMDRLRPSALIIETLICDGPDALLKARMADNGSRATSYEASICTPSNHFIHKMFSERGFEVKNVDPISPRKTYLILPK